MEILNYRIIEIFKMLAMMQFALFGLLFLVILAYVFYRNHLAKLKKFNQSKIDKLLLKYKRIKPAEEQLIIKNKVLAFNCFYQLEQVGKLDPESCGALLRKYFLDEINDFGASKDWYFRQLAAMILQLKYKYFPLEIGDELLLKKLLADDTPLVIINAALAICNASSQKLIDLLIETFVHERRSQYDLLRLILKEKALKIAPFVIEHLFQVQEIETRALCYRMLTDLPKVTIEIPDLKKDLASGELDLSLAALEYAAYSKQADFKDLLIASLDSPIWQVKVRAAKLIGKVGDTSLAKYLEPLLIDKDWWVRFRAAEALRVLGPKGVKILKRQTDPYAKDMAMQQLELMQQFEGK
jgi:hypothetical protein